jgi:hypothetical protein
MRSRESANSWTPIFRVRRAGAVVIGLVVLIFGVLVLAHVASASTHGVAVLGLTGNSLLGVISLVVGVLLVGAGLLGGRITTATTAVFAVLFVLSGVINAVLLGTGVNWLAFDTADVVFSLVVGVLLAGISWYGVFGGQYPVAGEEVDQEVPGHEQDPEYLAHLDEMAKAEHAVAEGTATREQREKVFRDAGERADRQRREAWQAARRQGA